MTDYWTMRRVLDKPNKKRVCINQKCGWVGDVSETVHPKHWPDDKLCPECYEVTEETDCCDARPARGIINGLILCAIVYLPVIIWAWRTR